MTSPPHSPRTANRALLRDGTAVAAAVMIGNLLGYVLTLTAVRQLSPAAWGELAALLGVLVVAAVSMMALQVAVALDVAGRARDRAAVDRCMARGNGVAVVVGVATLLAAPALAWFLHVQQPLALVWLAVAAAGMTLAGAIQGVLQGQRRFARLAAVLAVQGVGKVGGGLAGLVIGGDSASVLLGTAVGVSLATAWAARLAGANPLRAGIRWSLPEGLLASTANLAALFALANVDLLLARHYLEPATAGVYAAGAVLAKATFWAPQAVSTLALPHLADRARRAEVMRLSALALLIIDGVVVVACLAAPQLVATVAFGGAYSDFGLILTGFALLGGAWAMAQLLAYGALADGHARTAVFIWVGVVAEVSVVAARRPSTVAGLLTIALLTALALVCCLAADRFRSQLRAGATA